MLLWGCRSSPSMKGKFANEEIAWPTVDFPHPAGPPTMNRGISSGAGRCELLLDLSMVILVEGWSGSGAKFKDYAVAVAGEYRQISRRTFHQLTSHHLRLELQLPTQVFRANLKS